MYLRVNFLGHMIILSLTYWVTTKLFLTAAAPVYIPTSNAWVFQFLHVLANTCSFPFFFFFNNCNHLIRCEMACHCGFGLHFPNDKWCWPSFQVFTGHLYIFFREMSVHIHILCSFLIVFVVELQEFFICYRF